MNSNDIDMQSKLKYDERFISEDLACGSCKLQIITYVISIMEIINTVDIYCLNI